MSSGGYFPKFANCVEVRAPRTASKLRGYKDRWRIRIGRYRVVYTIDDRVGSVDITRIAQRKDAYE